MTDDNLKDLLDYVLVLKFYTFHCKPLCCVKITNFKKGLNLMNFHLSIKINVNKYDQIIFSQKGKKYFPSQILFKSQRLVRLDLVYNLF